MVDSSRSTVISRLLFRQEEVNLEKQGYYMLLYYQRRRFRIKCSCSIAFLRNVESGGGGGGGVQNTMPRLFCALKRLFILMSHLSGT